MTKQEGINYTIKRTAIIKEFQCLGDQCEDTCCKGWGMQFDQAHLELYQQEAPELLEAVNQEEMIMKRDATTDYCIKYDQGLCSLHKKYGEKFLGDACFFYPRVTKKLGSDITAMTATLSCPEIARLALYNLDSPFAEDSHTINRIPESTHNYMEDSNGNSLTEEQITTIYQTFIDFAATEEIASHTVMMSIISVARSLEYQDQKVWHEAVGFLLKTAKARFLKPEPHIADPYKLLHAFCALIGVAKKNTVEGLMKVTNQMLEAFDSRMDWEKLTIENKASDFSAYDKLRDNWQKKAAKELEPILKRYIQSQLSISSFPFAGFGANLSEKSMIMAIRFATVRLALMAHVADDGTPPDQETVVRVIQTICRFLDHLGDPTLSVSIYHDAGWTKEQRLHALLQTA